MTGYLRLFALTLSTLLLLYGSARAAAALPRRSRWQWAWATLVLFCSLVLAVEQVFGWLGALNSSLRYVAISAIGLALAARPWPDGGSATPSDSAKPSCDAADWRIAAVLIGAAAACFALRDYCRVLLSPPSEGGDSLSYHLPIAVRMLQTGSIWSTDAPFWYYPSHSELLTHWLIEPLRSDLLVWLQNIIPAVVLVCAMTSLLMRATRSVSLSLTIALCFAYRVTPVSWQLGNQMNDLFLTAFWLAGLAAILDWLDTKHAGWLAISALAMGLVLGTKYNGLYLFGVYGLATAVAGLGAGYRPRDLWLGRWLPAMFLAALVGGSWYLRNWIVVGVPTYPATMGIFPQNSDIRLVWENLGNQSALIDHWRSADLYRLLLQAFWRHAGAFVSLCLLLAPCSVLVAGRAFGPSRRFWAIVLLLCAVAPMVMPTSAENWRGTLNQLRMGYTPVRYGMPLLATSTILGGAMIDALRRRQSKWPLTAVLATLVISPPVIEELKSDWACYLAVLSGLTLLRLLCAWAGGRNRWPRWGALGQPRYTLAALPAVAAAAALGIALAREPLESLHQSRRAETYARCHAGGCPAAAATELFDWCERHIHGSVVIVWTLRLYPFFGSDYSNVARQFDGVHMLAAYAPPTPQGRRYVVVPRGWVDEAPDYRRYPPWKAALDAEPQRYRPVFANDSATVYLIVP